MAKKSNKKYGFIDKERLTGISRDLNPKVEKMMDDFYNFFEIVNALKKSTFIEFSYLPSRAGLTDKLMEKIEKAVEKFRNLYFEQMTDIFQTRIEDFTK